MITLQPSRVTPQTTTVVSFGKDKVTYNAVPINQPVVDRKRKSIYAQHQRTLDVFAGIDAPMTIQNFKNVDKVVNNKGKGKEVVKPLEKRLASTSYAPLEARISSPDEALVWCTDDEILGKLASPKMVADPNAMVIKDEDPYNFDEIAEAAGFDSGFINEGQVPSTVIPDINSHTKQSAFLAGKIMKEDLRKLSRSLNKYNVHASSCEKCKEHSKDKCQWIMDSGASKHFTPMLSDFADFQLYDGPILQTAAVEAPLQIKGEGTVFLSHKVTNKAGIVRAVVTRFYPVFHVPGMSVRLMSFGELLQNGCEVWGDILVLRFYKVNQRFPLLSVEPLIIAHLESGQGEV
jgi:hypothetical protein